ncbi:MAG: 1-acyl-sn-glycerol-3-phosphate acyltransferase, partial [Leptospirales bacterium]
MSVKIYRKYPEFPEHPGKRRLPVWLITLAGWTILRFFFRVRVEGLDRISKTGSVLLLPKHQRLMDIPLGFTYVIQAVRPDAWCLMKETLGGFGGFLLKCGGIPLNRANPEKSKRSLLMARTLLH